MFEHDHSRNTWSQAVADKCIAKSESQWLEYSQRNRDGVAARIDELSQTRQYLRCNELVDLHQLRNRDLYEGAGEVTCYRYNGNLDHFSKGHFSLPTRLRTELEFDLLNRQMEILVEAIREPEDEIRVLAFQLARFYALHPFDNGNKRLVRDLIDHFIASHQPDAINGLKRGQGFPETLIIQAVYGDNIAPLCRALCQTMLGQSRYQVETFAEIELTRFRVAPITIELDQMSPRQRRTSMRLFEIHGIPTWPVREPFRKLDVELAIATRRQDIAIAAPGPLLRLADSISAPGDDASLIRRLDQQGVRHFDDLAIHLSTSLDSHQLTSTTAREYFRQAATCCAGLPLKVADLAYEKWLSMGTRRLDNSVLEICESTLKDELQAAAKPNPLRIVERNLQHGLSKLRSSIPESFTEPLWNVAENINEMLPENIKI